MQTISIDSNDFAEIQRRKYTAPYRAAGKPVWAVGLSFDDKTRQFKGGVAEAVVG